VLLSGGICFMAHGCFGSLITETNRTQLILLGMHNRTFCSYGSHALDPCSNDGSAVQAWSARRGRPPSASCAAWRTAKATAARPSSWRGTSRCECVTEMNRVQLSMASPSTLR
jgi:hypothetical protein